MHILTTPGLYCCPKDVSREAGAADGQERAPPEMHRGGGAIGIVRCSITIRLAPQYTRGTVHCSQLDLKYGVARGLYMTPIL